MTEQFDLNNEIQQLRGQDAYEHSGRCAKTLSKHANSRIVLTALKNGSRLQEHKAEGRVSVHALMGRMRMRLPGETLELAAGNVVVLEPGVMHDLEALEESVFLLTVFWSKE